MKDLSIVIKNINLEGNEFKEMKYIFAPSIHDVNRKELHEMLDTMIDTFIGEEAKK